MRVLSLLLLFPARAFAVVDFNQLRPLLGGRWSAVQYDNHFFFTGRSAVKSLDPSFWQQIAFKLASKFGATGVELRAPVSSLAGVRYPFVPTLGGEPVENLSVAVSLDKEGHVIAVTGRLQRLNPPPPAALIDKSAVASFLHNASLCEFRRGTKNCNPLGLVPRPVGVADVAGPFLFATNEGIVRAYRVLLETDRGLGISEYTLTATAPLQVLQRRDGLRLDRRPRAAVFNPNPRAAMGDLSVDRASLPKLKSRVYDRVRLRGLRAPNGDGEFTLDGPYVHLDNDISPGGGDPIPMSRNGSFVTTVGNLMFASVMIYYHIDRMQRYVQELGFRNLLAFPIRVDPQYEMDALNSATDTNQPDRIAMIFGSHGNVFDAEDGDVIAHEYGHALQWGAAKTQFNPILDQNEFEVGAVSEGFGDYWAMSTFRGRNRRYRAQGLQNDCYAEWSHDGCTRIVNLHARREDASLCNDDYRNASVWTAVLWQIATELGRKRADRLILESHYHVDDRPNFCGSAMALLTADNGLYKGAHQAVLKRVFRERHIFGVEECKQTSFQ